MARILVCSATIPNRAERSAILAWVKTIANGGYSEKDDTIFMSYVEDPNDKDSNRKYWAVLHYFERLPDHKITRGVETG